MIKVVIERKVKKGEDISRLLRELRATAIHEPGYVTGETLVAANNKSDIIVVSTWQSIDHWKSWESSEARAKLYRRIEPLLAEKPKVRVYEILATEGKTAQSGA